MSHVTCAFNTLFLGARYSGEGFIAKRLRRFYAASRRCGDKSLVVARLRLKRRDRAELVASHAKNMRPQLP